MSNNPRKERIDAFISSTSIDLPEYRAEVIKVLNTLGIMPNGMEHWPVTGENPVNLCKIKVEQSEIYIGIYAYRYGWQPDGHNGKSITELEYDWAADVMRGGKPIPRLCFIMSDEHPWPGSRRENDKQGELDAFKRRVKANHAGFFTTPDNLATQLTAALALVLKDRYPEKPVPLTKCVLVASPPRYFAGRAEILADLKTRLMAGAVTAIHGVGGIGKTALALALVDLLAAESPGRQFGIMLWASINQLATEDAERAILREWALGLGGIDLPADQEAAILAPQVTRIITHAVQNQCGEPILLILDDVWPESLAMAKRLRAVVPPGARVLITTRSETVAIDLDCADLPLGKLNNADGALMLARMLDLSDTDQVRLLPGLETMNEILGGHPLSLRLSARAVKRRKVGGLDAVIADFRRGLEDGDTFRNLRLDAGDAKEDSVSVTLGQTLDTLTKLGQAQFRALGALPIDLSFSRDHLYALWGAPDESALETFLLEGLIENASDQPGRYQQHRLLRGYARGLLRENGELEEAQRRHYSYMIDFARDLFQPEKIETWDSFAADYPQIGALGDELVVRITGTRDPVEQDTLLSQWQSPTVIVPEEWQKVATLFAHSIVPYVYRRRIGAEGRRWLSTGLMAVRGSGTHHEALFLDQLGLWHSVRDYKPEALAYYEASLSIDRALGNRQSEAAVLSNIGLVYQARGELNEALDVYQQALLINQEVGDLAGEATTLNNIGGLYWWRKDPDMALKFYQQALPMLRAINNKVVEAITLNNIGAVYQFRGELDSALDMYHQSSSILRPVGDRAGEAITLCNIGMLYHSRGELDKTLEHVQQALPLLRSVGDRQNEAASYYLVGTIYDTRGNLDEAIRYIEQSVQILDQIGDLNVESNRRYLESLKRRRDGNTTDFLK